MPDLREAINNRHKALRTAARWLYDEVEAFPEEEINNATEPGASAMRAYNDILYKLQWVHQTGQGVEDIA